MDDYLVGVLSNIGVIAFIALSAYLLLLTGEISFGQQAFFAIGAYAAGIATALWGWPLSAALGWGAAAAAAAAVLVGVPTLRLHGLYFAIATLAFAEMVRLLFEQFRYQVVIDGEPVGPNGTEGFRGIRYIFENDVGPLQYLALIYRAARGHARRLHAAGALPPRRRLPHDRRGSDACRAQRHRGGARESARRRARRRARRSRRRALRAPDHLPRAAHLRRDARGAQPRLRADRRARHRARAAASAC